MSESEEQLRSKLQNLLRENIVLLSELNDVDKSVSRLRNELKEIYLKIDKCLDCEKAF